MIEVGEIRPSQLMFTYGVGSIVDLPSMSVMVMGIDQWNTAYCKEIVEDRLVAALQRQLGPFVHRLYLPPGETEKGEVSTIPGGVPVAPFPRWMRCRACGTLSSIDSGVFGLKRDKWRPERTRYVHTSCRKGKEPSAFPVRFLVACREGHISDFPWIDFVHEGLTSCQNPNLVMKEYGIAGDAYDITVRCRTCDKKRRVGEAFDEEKFTRFSPNCPGHLPHLRRVAEDPCTEKLRPISLGASNTWFPLSMSVLSLPESKDKLGMLIEGQWAQLQHIPSSEVLSYHLNAVDKITFSEYEVDEVWRAISTKRDASREPEESHAEDLKVPEWRVFSKANSAPVSDDFKLTEVAPPQDFETRFEKTVLVERIREVRALYGFTRIESTSDFTDATYVEDTRITRLSREPLDWLPASETRGEGIFLRLREERVQAWENQAAVKELERDFLAAHKSWRRLRRLEPDWENFPFIRYVLLHSLSHAIMRQLVLDSGYTSASLRERLYCKRPEDEDGPMAGILIYTAVSDSEGTLGGLVRQGQPETLGRHLWQTLESMRICASDPLCAEHTPPREGMGVHGATCHACLFAPETSCEKGNRYLDRSTLVDTLNQTGVAFFDSWKG